MNKEIKRTVTIDSNRESNENSYNIKLSETKNIEEIDMINAAYFLIQNVAENSKTSINELLDTMKTFKPSI